MGRKRKKKNKDLPKGVYSSGKGYRGQTWNGKKLVSTPSASTPEETEYLMLKESQGHHWKNMGDMSKNFGFIYLITNRKTGKRYVGSKQLHYWDGPVGGYKCTDKSNPWWDDKAWRSGNWEFYTSSSKPLNREVDKGNVWDFTYEVLEMCHDKLDLHMAEVTYMIEHDVLEAVDCRGDYLWYNENIASKEYRAPFRKRDLVIEADKSAEAMRVYYLKPRLDDMGCVIPFEEANQAANVMMAQSFGGGFKDVR